MNDANPVDRSSANPAEKGAAAAVEIEVVLPALLQEYAGGQTRLRLKAMTLQECFDALFERSPLLRNHLFTESGEQRPHVLFFYNEENTRWLGSLDIPLREGDTLTILQAVSGG